jgi:two-component system autoinducer 1 sensor kinase/phosphatase LuxN
MIFKLFLESLCSHPKGTLLILIALLNLIWMSYSVVFNKKYKTRIFRIYFFYAVFALLWVIANAYFQSKFLLHFGELSAKYMAIAANIASSLAAIGFYWLASAIVAPAKQSASRFRILIFVLIAIALVINLLPGLTVKEVRIFDEAVNGAQFELIFGKWNTAFFISGFILLGAAFAKFVRAVRAGHDRVENMRYHHILFGMSIMYGSMIVFHMIIPSIYGNYNYVWIPPLLTVLQVLIVGYAVITKRFIDISLFISRLLKLLIAFAFSVGIALAFYSGVEIVAPDTTLIVQFSLTVFAALSAFGGTMRFFNSFAFYRYFGSASENFERMVEGLKESRQVYTSIRDFERDIRKAFSTHTKGIRPRIVLLNRKNRRKYQRLIQHFRDNRGVLVTEEVKFTENEQERMVPFLRELESLGGVCLPLFHPSKGLVGLFTLGEKNYEHLYLKEEIAAIEDMGSYLNFMLTGILYNAELEDEVRLKTAEIRKKTQTLKKQVEELKAIFDQQADFVAVTAHEFRTPLSIALFQAADLMNERQSPKRFGATKAIYDSLQKLKDLLQKVFSVQQLDLKKVELRKEKTDMGAFSAAVFNEFRTSMEEHGLSFSFENPLKDAAYSEIDPSQIREVLSNLLDNARKFTPHDGKVVFRIAADKKEITVEVHDSGAGVPKEQRDKIFGKYGTNHNSQGIGLGLYICRKIMELHNGRIWVKDSKLLGGTVFGIALERAV